VSRQFREFYELGRSSVLTRAGRERRKKEGNN